MSTRQQQELTPIEEAIERALRKNARAEASAQDDAKVIARIVVKHWGNDAVTVLLLALDRAREEVGRWSPEKK